MFLVYRDENIDPNSPFRCSFDVRIREVRLYTLINCSSCTFAVLAFLYVPLKPIAWYTVLSCCFIFARFLHCHKETKKTQ